MIANAEHAHARRWRSASVRSNSRLVIADDSPDMRWLVHAAIGKEFSEVIEVADGRELLWTLLRSSFATPPGSEPELVVITDICMPAYDGLEVLDAWREAACDVPTIIMTAYPSAAVQDRADALGAFVLAKPFTTATLRWLVGEMIAGLRNR